MKIHWSPEAMADYEAIIQYIRTDNSAAAARVARTILRTIEQLRIFPTPDALGALKVRANWYSRPFRL